MQGEKVVGFKEMAGEERRKEGAAAAGQRRRVEGKKKTVKGVKRKKK